MAKSLYREKILEKLRFINAEKALLEELLFEADHEKKQEKKEEKK